MPASKRDVFKAVEVCQMAQLQPYVLRSWEAEFPRLGRPAENGGPRTYRRDDVELVLRIKQLVFGEGLTLAGARRRLEEEQEEGEQPDRVAALAVHDALDGLARARLRQIRTGLEEILALVGRDPIRAQSELTLVAPVDRPEHRGSAKHSRTVGSRGGAAKTAAKRRSATS